MDREYLNKMKERHEETIKKFTTDEMNCSMLNEGNLDDDPYHASTFLYIRAFIGDNGSRPIPYGQTYCLSPDIELYLNGAVVDTGNPLISNTNYTVKVTVTNDGDLRCNTCTVDLYLCDLSLGFSTKGGSLIGITNTYIDAHSSATLEFPFTTTSGMEGHRCMFARAYSLASNDYPADLINFNTYEDRHIGQQNLNIVKQGETLNFVVNRVIKKKVEDVHIVFQRDNSLFEKNQIISKRFALSKKLINTDAVKLRIRDDLKITPDIIRSRPEVRELPRASVKIDRILPDKIGKINEIKLPDISEIKRIEQGKWLHKIESGVNKMQIEIPMLGLEQNEALPMKLSVVDPETGESMGEITVIVVG